MKAWEYFSSKIVFIWFFGVCRAVSNHGLAFFMRVFVVYFTFFGFLEKKVSKILDR